MPSDERSNGRTRSRSRSPRRERGDVRRRSPVDDNRRERQRSGERSERHRHAAHRHHRHHHRHRDSPRESERKSSTSKDVTPAATDLPHDARQLSKNDLDVFRPLLAYYLDLQKQKDIRDMDDREVRGRWKSFVGKWNRGDLSRGWYDPEMFMKAKERAPEDWTPEESTREETGDDRRLIKDETDEEDDDDDLGPRLPPTNRNGGYRAGPSVPNMEELSLRRENLAEEAHRERESRIEELRRQRKEDRKTQRERLDDVAPRAEAGTRERMLEKRALVNDKMKEFRDKGGGDATAEVGEQELMGGGDSLAEFKAMKAREERKKTEREIRREEIARARADEREERLRQYREREERVMKGLREMARQRFGLGGEDGRS
ncbi:Uncharacterized protein C8034_v000189 [Colletotrichum sidae]|uniref:RNA helicase-like protein n=1 Tax=Colletotrichum sidae TaxID=1347389 RepID=A0A4R8TP52_9PEZI|nr:Uncharacterized protein C8034_v000189 [Colletotrichum sidae]